MIRTLALLAASALVAAAGPPGRDPDWLCAQRYVPVLSAASLWAGPVPQRDWRTDPAIGALVAQVADRNLPLDQALAKLHEAAPTDPESRAETFFGLVDRSNAERSASLDRVREISRRLRALSEAIARSNADLAALPSDTPEGQRADMVNRRALLLREYDSLSQTVRYACGITVDFEQRLGAFARALQSPEPAASGRYSPGDSNSGSTTAVGNPAASQPSTPSGNQPTR